MRVAQFPKEQSTSGEFERQEDAFRDWISADPQSRFPAVSGRYHLYVSLACPWASRTVILRKLLGLEHVVGMTVVDPVRDERGWAFRRFDLGEGQPSFGSSAMAWRARQGPSEPPAPPTDAVNGFHFLSEAYALTDPNFDGRVTVPVLWDTQERRIVNNSEDDICRMFNDAFRGLATHSDVDWFPADIAGEQQKLSEFVYDRISNGVYKAGFTSRQGKYEIACNQLFAALDELDNRLGSRRYLFGRKIVETDWRLFCTLIRFDVVYYIHFKCSLRRILDFQNLQNYILDLYQHDGIAETVDFDQIKWHYYKTHEQINPSGIVPIGPVLDLTQPHGREKLPGD